GGYLVEVEIGSVVPDDQQPVVSVVRVRLGALNDCIVLIQSSVSPDAKLVKPGEVHPRLSIDRTIGAQPEVKWRSSIEPIGAIAVGPRPDSREGVGIYLVIGDVDCHLKISRHVLEQEETIVFIILPSAILIRHGQAVIAG